MKRYIVSAAVVVVAQEMNFAIFENLSTTIITASFPSMVEVLPQSQLKQSAKVHPKFSMVEGGLKVSSGIVLI